MLSPTLAALQSMLNPLLITASIIVIVLLAALGCAGARSRSPPEVTSDDTQPGVDSSFAATASESEQTTLTATAWPAPRLLPMAADLLVVDDSAVARAKLRRLFATSGYEVQQARDGVEALALLQQGRYRLMITDLEMPNLDGVALINTCQGQPHTARMPILAITGHEDLQIRLNECQEICGIYRKPWIDEDLASHVALLLQKPAVRQAEVVEP